MKKKESPFSASPVTRVVAASMATITVLSLLLVSFRVIDWKSFWVVIIIAAFVAYLVVPYMKERGI